ncbi:MAG: hypothetical protein PHO62_08045 [Sulfurimonas sp.]|uniref:hypothetical protein n=1 Tax=Sulfurimonas sp. TaxID=2022749 RepID=UPI0026396F66|nr:hypothetical protein [Sulfurimonas sp.]MDD5373359.1 hypothetical protein [Sulfurimonas sp.]
MAIFEISIFDWSAVSGRKKRLDSFEIEADGRADAMDKAHTIAAERLWVKRILVEIREISVYGG